MSESDDTDILLLIPPNYYCNQIAKFGKRLGELKMDPDAIAMPPTPTPTSAAYKFLPPNKKRELNQINSRLQNLKMGADDANCLFASTSDISTISSSTVRTQLGNKNLRELHGLVHSTPKSEVGDDDTSDQMKRRGANVVQDCGILYEIDNYLDENNQYNGYNWQQHHSDDTRRLEIVQYPALNTQHMHAKSLPSALNTQSNYTKQAKMGTGADSKLISLSEIWGNSGQASTIILTGTSQSTLKEEQLRRHHLEKTVHSLQTQLLEYQQRISVAIEVDRTKDAALGTLQQENKTLNHDVQSLRDSLHKLESERQDYQSKINTLQGDLEQTINLASKFQEKNDKLEQENAAYTRRANDSENQHKEQIETLELQVHASQRAEECANHELQKLKDRFANVEYCSEKLAARNADLEKDNTTLKHQKEMLQEYYQKQKARADAFESQRKSFQETLTNLMETETTLKRKLETQQKVLKMHYQQQLEQVVAQKLREFQEQLDKNDECIKAEARERERLIAERAVKQLEMINEKNELELNLLQEKHIEEVELYRLQLVNASKKIDDLEMKLDCYKSKRADIAEKLHTVMETQWQKALEILTSPNQTGQLLAADTDSELLENNSQQNQTPKSSKIEHSAASNSTEKNNLDTSGKKDPTSPMDKLQAYIELLLSKSPSDFDKLDEILMISSKHKPIAGKLEKLKRGTHSKPPWKT